ncbi:MAG TPA: hypothetical protein VIK55_11105 [Paludibacter sp.]
MKKQVLIEESEARSMHKTATPEFKKLLETTFGKEFFSTKITDRIKSYEDACEELGISPWTEKDFSTSGLTPDEVTYRKIKTITQALNEGWKADWTDSNQYKYYPWFRMSSGGFVFYGTSSDYSYAVAGDASRLCFKSSELAKYAGEQFLPLYSDFII